MNIGVILILLSVLSLLASFVLDVPSWVNLAGIAFGIAGLVLTARRPKGGSSGGPTGVSPDERSGGSSDGSAGGSE